MYRFHLDIVCGDDQDKAISNAKVLIGAIVMGLKDQKGMEISYYLGNDTDRTRHNYLNLNENGHASKAKIKVNL